MRKTVYKIHSYIALVCFLPVLLVSLTGSILVYKTDIDRLFMPSKTKAEVLEARLSIDVLHNKLSQQYPEYMIGTWEIFNDERADTAYLIKYGSNDWYKVYVNQYSGEILSAPVGLHSQFTDWILNLHYTFLLHNAGLIVVAVFGLAYLLLGISGIVLHKNIYKHFFQLRWHKARVVLFSDVHKFMGALFSPVVLILGVTGLYWNIAEFVHETVEHSEAHPVYFSAPYNEQLSFQTMLDNSPNYINDFSPTYLLFAYEEDLNIMVYGSVLTGNPLYSNYSSGVVFDKISGEYLSQWDIRTQPTLQKVLDTFRELHFGTFGGRISQFIWLIAGLVPLILSITGIYVWMRRTKRIR